MNLYDSKGYRHAAELLTDNNGFPEIDVGRFGESINIIVKRSTFDHMPVLDELDNAVSIHSDYYRYEEIQGVQRKRIETIPDTAFRMILRESSAF